MEIDAEMVKKPIGEKRMVAAAAGRAWDGQWSLLLTVNTSSSPRRRCKEIKILRERKIRFDAHLFLPASMASNSTGSLEGNVVN
jgi:hypothetical protein